MEDKERKIQYETGTSLFGIEPEMSLQSVNFAPPENPLLNEQYEEEPKEKE
jgi:hypothetical protein